MEDTPDVKIRCSLIEEGFNYRRRFKPEKIAQMQASFDLHGLLNALIVRPLDNGRFQLLVGGYRYKSWSGKFGAESDIRANVRTLTDEQALALMMAENSDREDPSVIEDAEGAARMLGFCNGNRDEASARLGWTRSKLDRRLAVMNAVQSVRDAYLDDKLTVGHVEIFAALRSEVQERVMQVILQQGNKVPTVEQLKAMAETSLQSLESAIFDRTECTGCQFNTGNQQALFDQSFSGSRCTNKECYTGKTEAELENRKNALTETYQVVRIVRPGDNSTVIALRADGKRPVGTEQAAACRTCKDFGACVSGVPDSLGKTYIDVCFNQTCNDEKIDAHKKTLKDAENAEQALNSSGAGAAPEGAQETSSGAVRASAKTVTKSSTSSSSVRNAIQEYREKVWRLVFHRAVLKLPTIQSRALLIALIAHQSSHLDGSAAMSAINKALSTDVPVDKTRTSSLLKALLDFDQAKLATAFQHMASHVKSDMPIRDLVGFLNALEIRIEQHWKVNEDFFDLLTKTELDAVAEEIGLAKAAGKTYVSLKNGSKKEFVQAMLKVEGFAYVGAIPKLMRWDAKV
jgi:ParB family chromosome partitioning protein